MKHSILTIALLAGLAAAETGGAREARLPISRIVLFSSGVGYFEHRGQVEGNAVVRLNFTGEQMNDVLKSMIVMDLDGGSVTNVNYASQDPLIRALKSFSIDLSGDPDLGELLGQLRGAEVIAKAPEPIRGTILNVQRQHKVITQGGVSTTLTEVVLNLLTDEGIESLAMSSVQSLALTDAKLAEELSKALELILASHDRQRKAVEVYFAGSGTRRVHIGYIFETPVWKTSYRLALGEKSPLLQGWAIVENTTDSDWTNVCLSLVSGRPISFIQDLYTPFYMPRPEVVPQRYASLRPRVYEEGMEKAEKKDRSAAALAARRQEAKARLRRAGPNLNLAPAAAREAVGYRGGGVSLTEGVGPAVSAEKVGELFQFTISQPIDLPRRHSAMLPIVNTAIQAEKVSIYNASVQPKHPLNGAYLTNDTNQKFPAGPITVFDDGAYAGDAQLEGFVPGDRRLISYAVDLDVTVDASSRRQQRISSGRIVRGVLQVNRLVTYRQDYLIKNKADQPREVIVEHPFAAKRKLREPAKYEEKTPELYRFRVAVGAGETEQLTVVEDETVSQTIAILDRPARELKEQRQQIASGQDRLRRNISTVGRDSQLGRRYLAKLGEQEDRIERLEVQIAELQERIERQRKELADYLTGLNVS